MRVGDRHRSNVSFRCNVPNLRTVNIREELNVSKILSFHFGTEICGNRKCSSPLYFQIWTFFSVKRISIK